MSDTRLEPPQTERGPVPALLWACFLGCSWTWIIGMVFPVLLLRDYGVWGWVVFAVPNVLGAAAMGAVLAKPQWSVALAERHRDMALRFSDVTIAYHIFVLVWLVFRLWGWWLVIAAVVGALIIASRVRVGRTAGIIALVVWVASLVWLGIGLTVDPADAWVHVFKETDGFTPRLGVLDLILFAPASVMGFLCCPYLDLTFHRARQATSPGTGITAFILGFCIVFLSMIIGSLAYAGLLIPAMRNQPFELPATWSSVLAVHLVIQIAFTLGVHGYEVVKRVPEAGAAIWPRLVLLALAAGLIGYKAATVAPDPDPAAMSLGETIYRVFLLAYGLIFPAYVWLCVIPTIRPTNMRTRRAIFVVGVVITFPMGWLMFISGSPWWVFGILGTLLILRLFIETSPRYAPGSAPASVQSPPDR